MHNSYEKKMKNHFSEKKSIDSVEKLSKKMEYYDKLFNQVRQKPFFFLSIKKYSFKFESKFPSKTNDSTLKKPQDFSKEKKTVKEEVKL